MTSKVIILILCLSLLSCTGEPVAIPKPRTYPKIDFPDRSFESFELENCDFKFEYPDYAKIQKDNAFFDVDKSSDCWFDVVMPSFNGSLHCTHYNIQSKDQFDALVEDAFEMVGKHHVKADFRDEFVISTDQNVGGILFELQGPVACPLQFFLTDSTSNFLRGALYFNNQVAPDSMAPVHDFVKADILQMIETFRWQ